MPGRLYPLVATLLELTHRGHHVTVKAGIDDVEKLRSAGLRAAPLAPLIERFEPDDWKARTRFGVLMSGLRQFGERARDQTADLAATIDRERPDVLLSTRAPGVPPLRRNDPVCPGRSRWCRPSL